MWGLTDVSHLVIVISCELYQFEKFGWQKKFQQLKKLSLKFQAIRKDIALDSCSCNLVGVPDYHPLWSDCL
jgi:hypothetical protein